MTCASPARLRPRDDRLHRERGFTLIELLIAVAVIGILASIAVPSYQRYVEDSRRTDAHSALLQAAQQLERCYTIASSYENCNIISSSPGGIYKISVSTINGGAGFEVIASTDLEDRCKRDITLNHQGLKGPEECW